MSRQRAHADGSCEVCQNAEDYQDKIREGWSFSRESCSHPLEEGSDDQDYDTEWLALWMELCRIFGGKRLLIPQAMAQRRTLP